MVAQGNAAIGVGTARVDARPFPREGLERLREFMADHVWRPATHHAETALAGQTERSIEGFGRGELRWGRARSRPASQASASLQNWTHLPTSATGSEPCGTLYSSSMSAGNVHFSFRMS